MEIWKSFLLKHCDCDIIKASSIMYIKDINHVVCGDLTADKYSSLDEYCVREAGGNVTGCFSANNSLYS